MSNQVITQAVELLPKLDKCIRKALPDELYCDMLDDYLWLSWCVLIPRNKHISQHAIIDVLRKYHVKGVRV